MQESPMTFCGSLDSEDRDCHVHRQPKAGGSIGGAGTRRDAPARLLLCRGHLPCPTAAASTYCTQVNSLSRLLL